MKKHPIEQLIKQGEGQHLDFKFEISDAAKIARSLVAFANTDGGKLLIGVKDNGVIKGVASEEEYYMIENAARRFCKPEVVFTSKEWSIKGKKVLEITIPAGNTLPYRAPDKDGRYKAFIRFEDENLLATGVQIKIWKKYHSNHNISVTIEDDYKWLLEYLEEHHTITVRQFRSYAGISKHLAEEIISDLVVLDVLTMTVSKDEQTFSLAAV
jgi:predicted HTH transcriptional regulator